VKHKSFAHIHPVLVVSIAFLSLIGCGRGVTGKTGTNKDHLAWPRWRGLKGDGVSGETGWNPNALAGGPKILWKGDVWVGHSNVAIDDNRLYTMGKTRDKKRW
jgi:hypothetical protein